MPVRSSTAFRIVIVTLLSILVGAQTFLLPLSAARASEAYPEFGWLRWPLLALSIAVLGAVEVVLFGIWRLCALVDRNALFTSPLAQKWVAVELAAVVLGTALVAAIDVLLSRAGANPPIGYLLLTGATLLGLVLAALVVVAGILLQQESSKRRRLEFFR
jgi:hypothetical protein